MVQKRKRSKKNKKISYLVLILVLFVVAGVVVFLVWKNYFSDDKNNHQDNEDNGTTIEKVITDGKGEADVEPIKEKEPVVPYEGDSPNEASDLTGVVTYASVVGDKLVIRVSIDQYLDSGSCELKLIQDGVKYSASANISSVTTATCEGFDVPLSEIGNGNYQILINLKSGGKTGVISEEVDI